MAHDHQAGIARQAPGRFRGNVSAVIECGLAGPIGIDEDGRVHVNDHLVPLARSAGIDAVVKGRLREEGERVRLLSAASTRLCR